MHIVRQDAAYVAERGEWWRRIGIHEEPSIKQRCSCPPLSGGNKAIQLLEIRLDNEVWERTISILLAKKALSSPIEYVVEYARISGLTTKLSSGDSC